MKRIMIGLCFLGLTCSTFAQNEVLFKATLKKENVPTAVIEAIDEDFPGFEVAEFAVVPVEYIEDDVIVNDHIDYDNISNYQIELNSKEKTLTASYDENGKLMSTVEKLKDVVLPLAVSKSIYTAYPGWTTEKDIYYMEHFNHGKKKERYKLVLSKDGKKKRVYTNVNGKILNHNKKRDIQ